MAKPSILMELDACSATALAARDSVNRAAEKARRVQGRSAFIWNRSRNKPEKAKMLHLRRGRDRPSSIYIEIHQSRQVYYQNIASLFMQ